jgi:hypothetical protein
LKRRVWRTLRRAGHLDSPDYVDMATGVLLEFEDDDVQEVIEGESSDHVWDGWSAYWAFGHILFGSRIRYQPTRHGHFRRHCATSADPPDAREEA